MVIVLSGDEAGTGESGMDLGQGLHHGLPLLIQKLESTGECLRVLVKLDEEFVES